MSVKTNQLNLPFLSRCPREPGLSLRTQQRLLQGALLFLDALMLGSAFRIAYWLRFDVKLALAPEVVPDPHFYPQIVLIMTPVWILIFTSFGLYTLNNLLGGTTEYSRVFHSCTTGVMSVILFLFFMPELAISRGWLLSAWFLSFCLVSGARFLLRRSVYALRHRGYFLLPAVVVGANSEAVALAEELYDYGTSGTRLLGLIVSKSNSLSDSCPFPVLGSISETEDILDQLQPRELVVATTAVSREELIELFEVVNRMPQVRMRLSSGLFELLTTGVTVKTLGRLPVLSLNGLRLNRGEILVKRLLDITIAVFALLFLLPTFVLLAFLVKFDSRGPILHRRKVLGTGGREFDAFKFRTMHVDADDLLRNTPPLLNELNNNHKLKKDPRITRVGYWMRRYSLDELPQLFNVVLGQMSLVGPRMITRSETEKYGYRKFNLLTVKPGLTGLWQVSGRSDLTYEERVRLDMYYIRNYSIWRDLQILFVQTLPAVLGKRGAY